MLCSLFRDGKWEFIMEPHIRKGVNVWEVWIQYRDYGVRLFCWGSSQDFADTKKLIYSDYTIPFKAEYFDKVLSDDMSIDDVEF